MLTYSKIIVICSPIPDHCQTVKFHPDDVRYLRQVGKRIREGKGDLDDFDRLTSKLLNEWKYLGKKNRLKILQYIEEIKTPEEKKRQQIEQSQKGIFKVSIKSNY